VTIATIKLEGVAETVKRLEALPRRARKSIVRKAVRAGGAPFVKAVKANVPRRTGILKRSITQKVVTYQQGVVTLSIIGQQKGKSRLQTKKAKKGRGGISGRGDVVPIHFIEEDIKPHVIPGPVAIRTPGGQVVMASNIKHPGVKGRHPVRKAARQAERAAIRAFQDKMATEVDKEAAKIAMGATA
jgi:hypothetical protein